MLTFRATLLALTNDSKTEKTMLQMREGKVYSNTGGNTCDHGLWSTASTVLAVCLPLAVCGKEGFTEMLEGNLVTMDFGQLLELS